MANYERWRNRLQVMERKYLPLNLYLFLVTVISFISGALVFYGYHDVLPVKAQKTAELDKLRRENSQHLKTIAGKNLELNLEKEANANMEVMFVEQRDKIKDLERELTFYRSIMAPGKAAQGVSIYDLTIEPSIVTNQYDLSLILIQQKKRRRSLAGSVELTLIGIKDGKQVSQSVNELVSDKFNFKFRFFQMLETRLSFPEGTRWKQVLVKVKVPASRWSGAEETERTFDLKALLADDGENTRQIADKISRRENKRFQEAQNGDELKAEPN